MSHCFSETIAYCHCIGITQTFSLTLPSETHHGVGKTHHLVSYYKVVDVEAGRLRTPSSLPEFKALEISPEFLDKTHFRVPPRVEVGEDGRVRFRYASNQSRKLT